MVPFLPDAGLWIPAKARNLGLREDVSQARDPLFQKGTQCLLKELTVECLDTLPRGLTAILEHMEVHGTNSRQEKRGSQGLAKQAAHPTLEP